MARGGDATSSLAGIHVLVVEDHDDSRDVWERVLRYAGALVTAARTARQALELCASVHPDAEADRSLAARGDRGVRRTLAT